MRREGRRESVRGRDGEREKERERVCVQEERVDRAGERERTRKLERM